MSRRLVPSTGIKIATPHGKQRIVFDDKHTLLTRIAEADIVLVVIDERVKSLQGVASLLGHIQKESKQPFVVPIDINNYTKNTELLMRIFDEMGERNMTRKSLLVSIGGGSTSDLVGVAAAVYMRGIDYIVIPTSLISMADSVISKVAVNHGDTKNMIGAFRSPALTFIDVSLSTTHNSVNVVYGLVEILKQALLERNQRRVKQIVALLERIESDGDVNDFADFSELIRWSLKVKSKYIVNDWYDTKGKHKALSLGHTLANYLEMKGEYHHAVAVAYGMLLEYIIAFHAGLITKQDYTAFLSIMGLFERHFQQLSQVKTFLTPDELIPGLRKDKISHHGVVRFVLPSRKGYVVSDVSEEQITRALGVFHDISL